VPVHHTEVLQEPGGDVDGTPAANRAGGGYCHVVY